MISRWKKLNAKYWQSPKQVKGCWCKNQGPVTSIQICSTNSEVVQGSWEPITSLPQPYGSEAGEGKGGGESTCCCWWRKEEPWRLLLSFMLSDLPCALPLPKVPQPEIWRCLASGKRALCARKVWVALGIALRYSVSSQWKQLSFLISFIISGEHSTFCLHTPMSVLWFSSQSPDTVQATCNSYLLHKASYLWKGLDPTV